MGPRSTSTLFGGNLMPAGGAKLGRLEVDQPTEIYSAGPRQTVPFSKAKRTLVTPA